MRRQIMVVLAAGLVSLCAPAGADETLKTKPFAYHEDFEGTNDPVQVLSERGKVTVNFKGVTDEKACSGKKSYKVDVTLEEGGKYELVIPLDNIPIGANLKFSGMIRVEECPPKSRFILGLDFAYWPCKLDGLSGDRSFPWNTKFDGWVKIAADIPDRSCALAIKTFAGQFWGVDPGDISSYVQKIKINLFTRDKGEVNRRLVVYIDDLKIEGEVADKEEFRKDAEKRWEQVGAKTNKKIDAWESILARAEKELAGLTGLSGEAAKCKAELEKKLKENDVRKLGAIQDARKNGWMTAATYQKLEPFYNNLKNRYIANIKELSRPETIQRLDGKKHVVYAVNTTFTPADWVLPDIVLVPGRIADEINITACPGEYEPASFVVRTLTDIKSLKVEANDLKESSGIMSWIYPKIIPRGAVDIKTVKCWYQDEPGGRVLMPELLLNDDGLVMVDHEKKISRIKFNLPQGAKHLYFDDPEWPKEVDRKTQTPAWVTDDSDRLLPVDIAANLNRQFWVTVKVPDDARAGEYRGKINLTAAGVPIGEVALNLKVLPVKLLAPYYQTSVFGHEGQNTIDKRYRNELKDQLAHGISVPHSHINSGLKPGEVPESGKESDILDQLDRTLKIRKEVGLPMDTLIGNHHLVYGGLVGKSHKGLTHIEITDRQKSRFLEDFAKYRAVYQSYGVKEACFHLADERDAKELEAWLPVFAVVHAAGGKVITCLQIGNSFESVGGITDIFWCENGVSQREADKWHSKGSKIWAVWYPNGGVEDPDLMRRNHGLQIWKNNYDGVTEYLYSLEQAWNEAASVKTGAGGDGVFSLVYRTTEGVIDTIQWEGYREGIDDVRYVTTLEKAIKAARQPGDAKKAEIAAAAEKYLAEIDVEYGDLDEIRARIIEYLLKLRNSK